LTPAARRKGIRENETQIERILLLDPEPERSWLLKDEQGEILAQMNEIECVPHLGTIYAERLTATVNGIVYTWSGGFGGVITSRERGVRTGDVRVIGGVTFYAYSLWGAGFKREVRWVPTFETTIEWIREFKRALFSLEAV
jgi:hypothetical protein